MKMNYGRSPSAARALLAGLKTVDHPTPPRRLACCPTITNKALRLKAGLDAVEAPDPSVCPGIRDAEVRRRLCLPPLE